MSVLMEPTQGPSTKGPVWDEDLIALGYKDLPAPIPAVQATLSAIHNTEVHEFIIQADSEASMQNSEDGEIPMLLTTLDLGQWTRIFETANSDPGRAILRLKEAHGKLAELLCKDVEDYETANTNATRIERALKRANHCEDITVFMQSTSSVSLSSSSHPLLSQIKIPDAEKAALEDLQDTIQTTQSDRDLAALVSTGKHLAIPVLPPRAVEDQVTSRDHRVWTVGNINLVAPIPIVVWKLWAALEDKEVEHCKQMALNNTLVMRESQELLNAFPLSTFDHTKCSTLEVRLLLKQDLPTAHDRKDRHMQELWNCQRPYLRCSCNYKAQQGCKGSIIWFDHAVWYMVNHLEKFFPSDAYPSLTAKFGAFLIWIAGAGQLAVKCQLVFLHFRNLMIEAALQLADDHQAKLLPNLQEMPGARKIERLLKPPSFTLANPGTPSPGPNAKRHRQLNLNTPPSSGQQNYATGYARGSGGRSSGYSRGGRGRWNSSRGQYRRGQSNPPNQQNGPNQNDTSTFNTPSRQTQVFNNQLQANDVGQSSSVPAKASTTVRILSWDEA